MNRNLVTTLVMVAIAAGAAWYWTQGNTAGQPVGGGQLAAAGAPLVQVSVPEAFSAQAQSGMTYFNAVCASCHGLNSAGSDGVGPPLVHKIYEPSHHGDLAMFNAVRNGARAELGAIVAYVRELQRANGIN